MNDNGREQFMALEVERNIISHELARHAQCCKRRQWARLQSVLFSTVAQNCYRFLSTTASHYS